jgi:hypothetical protein
VTKKLPPNCRRTSKYRQQFFAAEDLSKLRGLGMSELKLGWPVTLTGDTPAVIFHPVHGSASPLGKG